MAFLDFLKKRQQQTAAPKPQQAETAKQMHTREAGQQTKQNSLDQMPQEQRAKIDEIKARMERATQHSELQSVSRQASQADAPVTQEAMRQNVTAQDKTAPALSPTSAQTGKTSLESGASLRPSPTPKVQHKTIRQKPQQTIARRPPSWER